MKIPKARQLSSGKWFIQLRLDGQSISITDDDKNKCEAKAMAYKAGLAKKTAVQDKTVGQVIEEYINIQDKILSPATVREYRRCGTRDIPEWLRNKKLSALTTDHIQKAINELTVGHSPKTVRNAHGLISSVLKMALPEMHLTTKLPKRQKSKAYVPSEADIAKLYKAIGGTEMEIPILLASAGSLRRSEICALAKSDITKTGVYISKALVMNENNEWVIKRPKTPESEREATLPAEIIEKLKLVKGDKITELNPAKISRKFSEILESAGIAHFRFHDLRHYWVSVAHAIGLPDQYIMQNGGWTTMDTPRNVYMYSLPESNAEYRAIMTQHFAKQYKEYANEEC